MAWKPSFFSLCSGNYVVIPKSLSHNYTIFFDLFPEALICNHYDKCDNDNLIVENP